MNDEVFYELLERTEKKLILYGMIKFNFPKNLSFYLAREAMDKTFDKRDKYKGELDFNYVFYWTRKIFYNLCIDRLKRYKKEKELLPRNLKEENLSPLIEVCITERKNYLDECLQNSLDGAEIFFLLIIVLKNIKDTLYQRKNLKEKFPNFFLTLNLLLNLEVL